jgi:hypothetical protein
MTDDDDSIEVHFDERRRQLQLECGHTAFIRILESIRTEASLDEIVKLPPNSVKWIGITDASQFVEHRRNNRWRDRLALLGCGAVAFTILFVFIMGILAIAGLVRLPR